MAGFKKPDSKVDLKDPQSSTKARKIFIGRTQELDFFVENILKPDVPDHNIISISGEGGVGKTELLHQFQDKARSPEFKAYCLTAWADEDQTTPAAIMQKFAKDLPKEGDFDEELEKYKRTVLNQKSALEAARKAAMSKAPEFGGAIGSMVPFAGELAKMVVSSGLKRITDADLNRQMFKDAKRLENPVGNLTSAFVQHINGLAELNRGKHWRRVILFFDTFEQLALEAAPWLLEYVLSYDLSYNIVLVVGGRVPIDVSIPDDPKAWLPFKEDKTIYSIVIKSFTEDETSEYLKEKGITEPKRVAAIWQSSRGLPIFLNLLTSSLRGEIDPTKDVVGNYLRWIPQEEDVKRRLSLDGAFFSRPFNRDDLEAFELLPEDFAYLPKNKREQTMLYNWLTGQDFVVSIPQDGRYSYQNTVRDLFSYRLYQLSQREYFATRKALIEYYQRLLNIIQSERGKGAYDSAEWLELEQALAYQLFMLPDETSHVRAIEQVLVVYHKSKQKEEMLGTLRRLSQGQPDKQVTDDTCKVAEQLIQYIEADLWSPAFLAAVNFLLEKATRIPSFSPEILSYIYRDRGSALIQLQDPQQAINDFNRAIELNSDEGWGYGLRGLAYTQTGDIQPAIEDFNQAINLNPDEEWVYIGRGLANLAIGESQQAIEDLERALELDPNNAWIYANRGLAYSSTFEFGKAIEDFNHALEMNPNEAGFYIFRCLANLATHNNQQAIEDVNRAFELTPNVALGYLSRGYVYASLNEPQKAIEDLDQAISLAPNYAQAYALRGYTLALLNRPEQAIKDCNDALTMAPNLVLAYIGRGSAYSSQNKLEQAIEDYNHALELAPNFSLVYLKRGFVYSSQNKSKQAIEDFNHALELVPNLGTAYSGRGLAYSILNQFDQAIADCDRAVELDPKDAWAYFYRGSAYLTHSDFQQAITDFDYVAELDPKLGKVYSARGLAYASMNEPLQALQDCNYAIELDQRDALAYVGRAAAYILLNQFQQTIEDCNQALELAPDVAQAYLCRGQAHLSLDEFQKAFDDYNHAIVLMPQIPQGYIGRGLVYAILNEPQQAFGDLNHALELAPNLPQAYIGRGQSYLIFNEFEQAIENFNRAIEMAPALAPALVSSLAQAYVGRGNAYSDLKEYERAIENYNHALELDPKDASVYSNRGYAYLNLKEYERAIEDFNRSIELNSDEGWIYDVRGFAYAQVGDIQSAIEDYNRALELDPKYANAYSNRGNAYYALKQYELAIEDYSRALEVDSQYVDAYIKRGNANYALEQYERAIEDYEYAIKLNPEDSAVYTRRAYSYLWLRNIEQAHIDFMKCRQLEPTDVDYSLMTEWVIICQEKPGLEMAERLEVIATVDPDNGEAYAGYYVYRGVISWIRTSFEEAVADFNRAIELDPELEDSFFWKGMVLAYLGKEDEAIAAIEKSLELRLPPVLLTPLRWIEQDRPDFYKKYVVELLARYKLFSTLI
jgi:tetratricopeptide (TPR) repeat protein